MDCRSEVDEMGYQPSPDEGGGSSSQGVRKQRSVNSFSVLLKLGQGDVRIYYASLALIAWRVFQAIVLVAIVDALFVRVAPGTPAVVFAFFVVFFTSGALLCYYQILLLTTKRAKGERPRRPLWHAVVRTFHVGDGVAGDRLRDKQLREAVRLAAKSCVFTLSIVLLVYGLKQCGSVRFLLMDGSAVFWMSCLVLLRKRRGLGSNRIKGIMIFAGALFVVWMLSPGPGGRVQVADSKADALVKADATGTGDNDDERAAAAETQGKERGHGHHGDRHRQHGEAVTNRRSSSDGQQRYPRFGFLCLVVGFCLRSLYDRRLMSYDGRREKPNFFEMSRSFLPVLLFALILLTPAFLSQLHHVSLADLTPICFGALVFALFVVYVENFLLAFPLSMKLSIASRRSCFDLSSGKQNDDDHAFVEDSFVLAEEGALMDVTEETFRVDRVFVEVVGMSVAFVTAVLFLLLTSGSFAFFPCLGFVAIIYAYREVTGRSLIPAPRRELLRSGDDMQILAWLPAPVQFLVIHSQHNRAARRLFYFIILNFCFMVVELFFGIWNNSLGLLSDAGHMFFDCCALTIGLFAEIMTDWKPDERFTYGYGRFEAMSGFFNAVLLIFIAAWVFLEGVTRLFFPAVIYTDQLLLVSVLGLVVNLVGVVWFAQFGYRSSEDNGDVSSQTLFAKVGEAEKKDSNEFERKGPNFNMRGIFLHIFADAMGSVGVIISAILVQYFDLFIADPICSFGVCACIIFSLMTLLRGSAGILLLKTPEWLVASRERLLGDIEALEGIVSLSNVHFWETRSEDVVCTVDVQATPDAAESNVLRAVSDILAPHVRHLCVQVEK